MPEPSQRLLVTTAKPQYRTRVQGSVITLLEVVTKVLAPERRTAVFTALVKYLKPERLVVTKHGISGVSTQILVYRRKQTNDGTIQTRDISCTRNHRIPTRNISALRI